MAPKAHLESKYPWAKYVLSPDTIVPHRHPAPLARRLQQICTTLLVDVLADEEVSSPQTYHAVSLIDDFPGIDQRRLAEVMGIDRTNVGHIVDDLEVKGFVRRRVNGADRRARELYVTASGAALRRRIRPKNLAAQDS